MRGIWSRNQPGINDKDFEFFEYLIDSRRFTRGPWRLNLEVYDDNLPQVEMRYFLSCTLSGLLKHVGIHNY